MADGNAPTAEGQRRGRKPKNPKYLPYTGSGCLERPDGFDSEKGKPYMNGKEEGSRVPFNPTPRYAVIGKELMRYQIGRGGVHKRSVCNLQLSSRDKKLKTPKLHRVKELLAELKKAGIPGAV